MKSNLAPLIDQWGQLRRHWEEQAKKDKDYTSSEERELLTGMDAHYNHLVKLGWQNIIFCPKDGSTFLAICPGTTRVCKCEYQGEWPKGAWWALEAGDMWPVFPILWKPMLKGGEVNTDAKPPLAGATGSVDWRSIADDLATALERLDALYQSEHETETPTGRPEWLRHPWQRYWHAVAQSPNAPSSATAREGKKMSTDAKQPDK